MLNLASLQTSKVTQNQTKKDSGSEGGRKNI